MSSERKADLAKKNHWDELLALRDQQREERKDGIQVVKLSELPQENNAMGLMRWYLHPSIKDTVLTTTVFFEQEIPPASRTGKLQFQGGQVMYILEGKGHTLLDGVRHSWKEGDVVNLPIKIKGVIVQHFNDDPDKPAKFIAVEPNFYECTTVDRGSGFELIEPSPHYER
jgi:ethanolamine utilization protein EutQ (cupin superfamily)